MRDVAPSEHTRRHYPNALKMVAETNGILASRVARLAAQAEVQSRAQRSAAAAGAGSAAP
ncbi:hypothetical protein JKG68_17600 [Microvirga aerilata]|uniref:Uncharacterized protein n=1 Tax=Microvirga aerilata TaxID=670292 RepID=A0A937CXM5_9HYPH|nr:hypothetical protein [Microvirga aerilata]MBL0405778.1 hypothetical protein [Microvirga aerilata]